MTNIRAGSLGAMVVALVLAGCSGRPEQSKVEAGSKSSATPTPTATTSKTGTLLDLVPPKPERPKDERTKAGAIAFTDYAFKSIYYAYGISDPKPITDISDSSTCRTCKDDVANATVGADNGRLLVGTKQVAVSSPKVTNVEGEFATLQVNVERPELVLIFGKADGDRSPAGTQPTTVNLQWQDTKWVLLDYESISKS